MSQQSPLSERSYFKRYKKPIRVSIAIIFLVIVLIIPIIPIQKTVTKTRTRNLQYSSAVYSIYNVPKIINVTNKDTVGGSFTVTMKMWYNYPNPLEKTQKLEDTFTEASFIAPKTTHTFNLPSDWLIIAPMYELTYSVSAPSIQVNYNATETEYKSILVLLLESWLHIECFLF